MQGGSDVSLCYCIQTPHELGGLTWVSSTLCLFNRELGRSVGTAATLLRLREKILSYPEETLVVLLAPSGCSGHLFGATVLLGATEDRTGLLSSLYILV